MSAGRFELSKYQARYGAGTAIHPIQVQPETLLLTIASAANDEPAGEITSPISARVSGGRREVGLNAELVRFTFDEGEEPAGYKADGVLTLPLLSTAIRVVAIRGATGTYLGAPITVVGRSAETVR